MGLTDKTIILLVALKTNRNRTTNGASVIFLPTPNVAVVMNSTTSDNSRATRQCMHVTTPLHICCLSLMVRMSALKPLLARTTSVVRPDILSLSFTVMLTLVRPSVVVLPIVLLATVMIVLERRTIRVRCSPLLGEMCLNMRSRGSCVLNLVLASPRTLVLSTVFGLRFRS